MFFINLLIYILRQFLKIHFTTFMTTLLVLLLQQFPQKGNGCVWERQMIFLKFIFVFLYPRLQKASCLWLDVKEEKFSSFLSQSPKYLIMIRYAKEVSHTMFSFFEQTDFRALFLNSFFLLGCFLGWILSFDSMVTFLTEW